MIYIKRVVAADKSRQLGLTKETSLSFFHYDGEGQRDVVFKVKNNNTCYAGSLRRTGNSYTITGEFSSLVRRVCNENDLIIFATTNKDNLYLFQIINQGAADYEHYLGLINEFGAWSGVIERTTHLLAGIDWYCNENNPLQKIVYGAPGTGKSFGTEDVIKGVYPDDDERKEFVFRTTFHPDSDYSTFVGCYKPTKKPCIDGIFGVHKLHEMFAAEKDTFPNRPEHRFVAKYYKSFAKLTLTEAKLVFDGLTAPTIIDAEIPKAMASLDEFLRNNGGDMSNITYEFVPQAFTKAYCKAMENPDKAVFLVIEEINRGNCAQIFGDIFQLLDRNDAGWSTYAIKPDNDLEQYLADRMGDFYDREEGMKLPPNLHIWATMNTSDQSLFPIDSAFKRRWDWQYVKIDKGVNEWKIDIGNEYKKVDWWEFLRRINKEIATQTSSEDKQLGYYFCKPDEPKDAKAEDRNIISADRFRDKVLFYLWNDVFKDFAYDLDCCRLDGTNPAMFAEFFGEEGEKNIVTFLEKLKPVKDGDAPLVKKITREEPTADEDADATPADEDADATPAGDADAPAAGEDADVPTPDHDA